MTPEQRSEAELEMEGHPDHLLTDHLRVALARLDRLETTCSHATAIAYHDSELGDRRQTPADLVERLAVAVLGELDISHASPPTEAALRDRIARVLGGGK